jgi:type II secretion system protein G
MRLKPNENRIGFTLIELLVVMAIIGLLASIVLVGLNNARVRARDARRVSDITQLQTALGLYYNDNGQYPTSGGATSPNGAWTSSDDNSWATLQSALSNYISKLPKDPKQDPAGWGNGNYVYSYYADIGDAGCTGSWYIIVYQLETANGPDPGFAPPCSYFIGGEVSNTNRIYQYGGSGSNTTVKTAGD